MELYEFEEKMFKREYPLVKISTLKGDFLHIVISHYMYEDLEGTRTLDIPVIDLSNLKSCSHDDLAPYLNILKAWGEGVAKLKRNGTLYICYLYKYDYSYDVIFKHIKSFYESSSEDKVQAMAIKINAIDKFLIELEKIKGGGESDDESV